MEPSQVATLMQHAILTVFYMTAPMLLTGLAIGVGVSIFQAVTQINEVTLVFIPKMMGVGLAMWISGAWIYGRFELFMMEVVATVSQISGGGH
jgi:flagellar biosynthetic protein FliQ